VLIPNSSPTFQFGSQYPTTSDQTNIGYSNPGDPNNNLNPNYQPVFNFPSSPSATLVSDNNLASVEVPITPTNFSTDTNSGISNPFVPNTERIFVSSLEHTPEETTDLRYVPSIQSHETVSFSSSRIPNRKEIHSQSNIPAGFLLQPLFPIYSKDPNSQLQFHPPCLRRPATICSNESCSAIINRYSKVDLTIGAWACNFCGTRNINKEQYQLSDFDFKYNFNENKKDSNSEDKEDITNDSNTTFNNYYPELSRMIVEYLDPSKQIHNSNIGFNESSGNKIVIPSGFIFLIDLNLPFEDFQVK
jgi:hypothetical protein